MSQAGGSANINGILYQLLGTLGRALTAKLQLPVVDGEEIKSLRLTIEPEQGGGDLQLKSGNQRRVEQWKAKSGGGTWSLSEVIDEVFPDLYKAIPADISNDESTYLFVTEGSMGKWENAYKLFRGLTSSTAADLAKTLPDSPSEHKIGKKNHSDRALFERIVERISDDPTNRGSNKTDIAKRVWHLLRHFEMPLPLNKDRVCAQVNSALSDHVDDLGEVDGKRRELCGLLLDIASKGESTVTAETLLRKAGIPVHTFQGFKRLRERIKSRLKERLGKAKYESAIDVRPHLVGNHTVTAISGEGGQGKTWHLGRFATDMSDGDSLIIWVPSARNNGDVAELAAREIWNFGLERDPYLDLQRIAEHRVHANPDVLIPWAIVCVDDVNSREEAEYICGLNWGKWGLRLAFTTNVEVGRWIEDQRLGAHVPISDFSTSELHRYLELRGKQWKSIDPVVEQLIRRPILASAYAATVLSTSWRPESEYEVIEAFWNVIRDPVDKAGIRKLAITLVEDTAKYPWPADLFLDFNVTDESRQRLIDAGWLKDADDDSYVVWHQRLLAWTLAEALAARLKQGGATLEATGKTLSDCSNDILAISSRVRLGFVPMDVLWLAFDPSFTTGSADERWKLIEALEKYGGYGHRDDVLYEELIATLGARAIPHIVSRVKHSAGVEHNRVPRLSSVALTKIGQSSPSEVGQVAINCVNSDEQVLLELGLRLTSNFPAGGDLERLWKVHLDRISSSKPIVERHREGEVSRAAFRARLKSSPEWLDIRLTQYDENPTALSELLFTLGDSEVGEALKAGAIWDKHKARLIAIVPEEKRRGLAACILRFRDTTEITPLESWVKSEVEFVGSTSFQILSFLDPDRAAGLIDKIHFKQFALSAGNMALSLLTSAPAKTCEAVCKAITAGTGDLWPYFAMASSHGDRLDSKTINLIVDWLDDALGGYQNALDNQSNPVLWRPLEIVDSLWCAEALAALRSRRGSEFESRLTSFACSKADNNTGYVDHQFDHASSLLKRIAGDGYTSLTNALLSATSRTSRLEGCEEAVVRPNADTLAGLREAAMSDTIWDSGASGFPVVQQRAIDSLAALGRNKDLVDAVVKWGSKVSPYISRLRAEQPPMKDDEFADALTLLDRPTHPQHANAILAIGQTGRSDMVERITKLFEQADPASDVAFTSILALEDLTDDFSGMVERLTTQYRSKNHKFPVLQAILKAPDKLPTEFFFKLLPADQQDYDDIDERLLSFLIHNDDTRGNAQILVRQYFEKSKHQHSTFLDSSSILDPQQPSDQEALWQRSRWREQVIFTSGSKAVAIRRLAAIERDAAYETALEKLYQQNSDQVDMPDVLIEIDKTRAVVDLWKFVAQIRDKTICRRIGVVLRRHCLETESREPLKSCLSNPDWKARRSATMVAGYLGSTTYEPELRELLANDSEWNVCTQAQLSLRMMQKESEAARLISSLGELEQTEVWGTIDCILQLADPDILVQPTDPLGFIKFLEATSFVVRKYTSNSLEKRQKKIESDFTSLQGKWKDKD
jgi:hypothetical protein